MEMEKRSTMDVKFSGKNLKITRGSQGSHTGKAVGGVRRTPGF